MSSPPAGWYVDPSTGSNLRFWNGSTWTVEVAPLPYEPIHSGEVDLGASAVAAVMSAQPDAVSEPAAISEPEIVAEPDTISEPEIVAEPDTASEPASAEEPAERAPHEEPTESDLDPGVEPTRLTRRQLRARRGSGSDVDDAPRHLLLIAPPTAVSVPECHPPADEHETAAAPVGVDTGPAGPENPPQRRRLIRMSALLGILAVVSGVGLLTVL